MKRIGLCLEPLDVLFFRDGRPFGAASRLASGLPTPQVFAGAIRTALLEKYGCSFAGLKRAFTPDRTFAQAAAAAFPACAWIGKVQFRGPWLCRLPREGAAVDVYLPAPSTIHTGKKGAGGVRVLVPRKADSLPGWRGAQRPLWLNGAAATEPATGHIDLDGLKTFLEGGAPAAVHLHKPDEFYTLDQRTGIRIHADHLVAGDGEIYGVGFLSVKKQYGFYAELLLPDEAPGGAVEEIAFLAFGGEGKRVKLTEVTPVDFPRPPECSKNQKRFVVLTTPGVNSHNGQPYSPRGAVVAAAVNSPVAISGWDIAKNGPKPLRFAAPAGSVYFLDSADPVPEQCDEFGYGCHLQGVWTDA